MNKEQKELKVRNFTDIHKGGAAEEGIETNKIFQ